MNHFPTIHSNILIHYALHLGTFLWCLGLKTHGGRERNGWSSPTQHLHSMRLYVSVTEQHPSLSLFYNYAGVFIIIIFLLSSLLFLTVALCSSLASTTLVWKLRFQDKSVLLKRRPGRHSSRNFLDVHSSTPERRVIRKSYWSEQNKRVVQLVHFGADLEGPPRSVHGGCSATVVDSIMGQCS